MVERDQSGYFTPELIDPVRTIGTATFDFSRQVAVMAIVNRTPDSFYDKGRTFALDDAIAAAATAFAEGAAIVDIGGVPFGPLRGASVSEKEEIDRVIPLVHGIKARNAAGVVSVDTYRVEVARQAIESGADIINDTSGLQDPALADLIAETGTNVSLIITHSLASPPHTPVVRPAYADIAAEVSQFLADRVELAIRHGVRPDQLIVDPGHDLNKNTYHSLELTRRLSEVAALGYPTLAAVSNKDFIGETLDLPKDERLEGTIAALVVCILRGARLVRVHDVRAAVAATRTTEAILGWRPPAAARHNLG